MLIGSERRRHVPSSPQDDPESDGVFSFHANDAYGLDKRSVVVIKLEKGQWKLVP